MLRGGENVHFGSTSLFHFTVGAQLPNWVWRKNLRRMKVSFTLLFPCRFKIIMTLLRHVHFHTLPELDLMF